MNVQGRVGWSLRRDGWNMPRPTIEKPTHPFLFDIWGQIIQQLRVRHPSCLFNILFGVRSFDNWETHPWNGTPAIWNVQLDIDMALHVFGRWLKYDCSLVEYQELYTCAVFILRQIVLSIALTLAVQDIWAAAKYQSNIEYFTTGWEGSGLNLLKFEDPCQGFRCWWMKTQRCERDGLIFDAGQGQCLKGPLLLGPHPPFLLRIRFCLLA